MNHSKMYAHPVDQFVVWHSEYLKITQSKLPSSCCLSTIGLDGFPNARFVALKEFGGNGFVVTGPLNSRKGREIANSNKVALTFWWEEAERQIRIQGHAFQIGSKDADVYFSERNYESRIVAVVSTQGDTLEDINQLITDYESIRTSGKEISRPESWGGYLIEPFRIEFLEFKPTRFHDRTLYELKGNNWQVSQLQP